MRIQRSRIVADDELDVTMDQPEEEIEVTEETTEDVDIEPEATDLLFETEDVAQLIAEVTNQPVDVTADDLSVTFTVGDEDFIVEAEDDDEFVESCSKVKGCNKVESGCKDKDVKASKKTKSKKVEASTDTASRKSTRFQPKLSK